MEAKVKLLTFGELVEDRPAQWETSAGAQVNAAVGDISVNIHINTHAGAAVNLALNMSLAKQAGPEFGRPQENLRRSKSLWGHMKSWYGILLELLHALSSTFLWYAEHEKNPLLWFFWLR